MTNEPIKIMSYDLERFRNILDVLASCNDEHKFKFTKEGLEIKTVDNSNVCLIHAKIPVSSFNEYSVTEDLEIGVPVETILGKLRIAFYKDINLGSEISISIGKIEDKNTIICEAGSLTFIVTALENMRKEPRIPQIELPFEYTVATTELYGAIELMYEAEHICFNKTTLIQKNKINGGVIKNVFKLNTVNDIKDTGEARSMFSREYLVDLVKPLRDIKYSVKVSLGMDYPLVLTSEMDTNEVIQILLAPRIEHE